MIATYIQELLATNNRVIVPNYGAFLVRATSKSKDANNLEEKLKDIYFSPFLKFNDELLEKYIIKKEKLTKEQAAEKIKEFIEDIKKELEQEKPYVIKGFGEFVADKQGKVQFLTIAKPVQPETGKKTTTAAKPVSTADGEEKKATTKSAIKKPTATKSSDSTDKKEEKKTSTKAEKTETKSSTSEIKKEDKPTSSENKLKEFKPEKEAKTKKVDAPISKLKETEKKPIYSSKKEKKPINKGLVWSIAIGLPVAAIFIWAVLNFNTVKKVFNKEKTKTEKVAKQKKTTTKKAVVKPAGSASKKKTTQAKSTNPTSKKKISTKKKTAKKTTTTKQVKAQKKYYIIAGSFKNEKYAASYLAKLQTEGYNAEKLAKRNGMYAVSYNSFTDKRKAIAEYKFIVQEKQLQAWILYY